MKIYLLFFFFLLCSLTASAQYRPAVVKLKSGDSITAILGKIQHDKFKYKTHKRDKAKEIDPSEIDFISINSEGEITTYRFFQLDDNDKYTRVKQLVIGKNAILYAIERPVPNFSFNNIPSPSGVVFQYYLQRPSEDKLTLVGVYDPVLNNLKEKVIEYFSDCPELVEKIQNKDFRMRNGLIPVVEFYNSSCNSL